MSDTHFTTIHDGFASLILDTIELLHPNITFVVCKKSNQICEWQLVLLEAALQLGVLKKTCSENMQQIYRRTPMPKCDFNKCGHVWMPASVLLNFISQYCKQIFSFWHWNQIQESVHNILVFSEVIFDNYCQWFCCCDQLTHLVSQKKCMVLPMLLARSVLNSSPVIL